MSERLQRLRKKAMRLPLLPGVYIMKNKQSQIIYIGKAKALKNRVSQYFGSQNRHAAKVLKMVENVEDFDYIVTDSEFEALVLECSLIKQHMPKYNILLKDDKGYSYIKITGGKWKKLSAVLQRLDDGAEYIGPYTSSFSVKQSVDAANKIFRLPQCNKEFPRDFKKGRPCLNYYISQCCGVCTGKVSPEEYAESFSEALEFLKGDSASVLRNLKEKMNEAAENLEFEKAARLRDKISAIEKMKQKQKVVYSKVEEQDVFAIAEANGTVCLMVLRFADGRLFDSEHFFFESDEEETVLRANLITSYYSMRESVPPRVTLDGEVENPALLEQWLSEKRGKKVSIIVPQKGVQLETVSLCRDNAAEKLAQKIGRTGREVAVLDELKTLLGLSKLPEYIESYDISHTAGQDSVAGMIVFKNAAPYKRAYKRFAIKTFTGNDDYRSMNEVLTRRFSEYERAKAHGETEGFGRLPDLILLDGGQGQVNAVLPVLKEFGLDIPLFGMVKDDKHRTRAIAQNGGEIAIHSKRRVFTLISEIQNEVHRFSVEYHRQKHAKRNLAMSLTEIDGIGREKAKALFAHFKTIAAVRKASVEQLCEVDGVSEKLANNIYKYYHEENEEN